MRNPTSLRMLVLLTFPLVLLVLVAIIVFVLERVSNSLVLEQTTRNWRYGGYNLTIPGSNGGSDIDIIVNINQDPSTAILAVCALACFVAGIAAFGIWELRRVEGSARHQRIWSWSIIASCLIMMGVSAGVLGYASALQSSEKRWQSYQDVTRDDRDLTRETWNCLIHELSPDQEWAGTACRTATASRYVLIAMLIASILMLGSLWLLIRPRGGVKWLLGGKGRYGGFPSVYEMQPPGNGPSYAVQPAPQWVPYPVQQSPQQSGQQWAQYPPPAGVPQPIPQAPQPDTATKQREVYG